MFSTKLLPQFTSRLNAGQQLITHLIPRYRQSVYIRTIHCTHQCLRGGAHRYAAPDKSTHGLATKLSPSSPSMTNQSHNTSNNILDLIAIDGREVEDRKIDGLSEDLDPEVLDELSPALSHGFNLSAFADKSETIQMFVKLGVDLSWIERRSPETAANILKLDFEADVKPYLQFLVDTGVPADHLGYFLTRNPNIFWQHMDDLEVRLNYLRSKRFNKIMIASVVTRAPKWLNYSTKSIDYKLGFIQKEFHLTADEIRDIIPRYPRLALMNDMSYRDLSFALKEEFGFNLQEIKEMLLKSPIVFRNIVSNDTRHRMAVKLFDLIHNEMGIPHELICKYPLIFTRRITLIESRHLYLKTLGRHQYDPKQPLYVPLSAFYMLDDTEFCDKYAKTNVQDFNAFCKTL